MAHITTKTISSLDPPINDFNERDNLTSQQEENELCRNRTLSNEFSSSASKISSMDHHSKPLSSLGEDGDLSSESFSSDSSYSSAYDSNDENDEMEDNVADTTEPLIKVMERLNKTIERLNEMESKTMTLPNEDNPNSLEHIEKTTFDDITKSSTNEYPEQQCRTYKGNYGDDFSSELTNLFRGGISRGPPQPDFVLGKKQDVIAKDTTLKGVKRMLPVLRTDFSMKGRRETGILDQYMYCCSGTTESLKSPRVEEWNVSQEKQ
jgi:hypothetical protein